MLDVWEGEPGTQRRAAEKVDIGTPHIAGYTSKVKHAVLRKCLKLIASLLGMNSTLRWILLPRQSLVATAAWPARSTDAEKAGALVYDVRRDDAPLRKVAGIPGEFDKLRKNYLERREWSSLYVICDDASAASLL